MPLIKKLLAGLSSFALLAGAGVGANRAGAADNLAVAIQDETAEISLSSMSLSDLYSFVANNVSATAGSPEEAARQFADLVASLTVTGTPEPSTLIAVSNAFQFMQEVLVALYGPIDAEATLAAARTAYVAALPTAAGGSPENPGDTVGPDFEQVATNPY